MTKIADFYWAIPILSTTLVSGLLGSRMFTTEDFSQAAGRLLHIARKLRNAVFFREYFVLAVG